MAPSTSNNSHDNPSADKNGDESFTNTMIDSKDPSTFFKSRTDSGSAFSSVTTTSKYSNGKRRSYEYRKNRNRIEVTADESITKESLLWFQSLRKHWLNSPRTPIQPILPIPPITFDTEPRLCDQIVSTATSKNINEGVDSNVIVVKKSFTKKEETKWTDLGTHRSEKIEKDVNNNSTTSLTTTTTTTASMNTNHRERLIQFYTQYNPSKLNTIDTILQKYYHREEELFQKLYNQYCCWLAIPTNINHHRPIVFLEFEFWNTNNNNNNNNNRTQPPEQKREMIQIQLFHDVTPYTAENFRCLCTGEKGNIDNSTTKLCYINTYMHRIVPMCVQGGDITTGDGTGGRSIYNASSSSSSSSSHPKTDLWGNFMDETFMTHSEPGLLSMANNGPDRNNSQFFITVRPLPHLNGKHVVFGKVIRGMDVIYDVTNQTITDPNTQRPLPDYAVKIVDCGEIQQNSHGSTAGETWIRASGEHRNDTSNCKPQMNQHAPPISEAGNTRPSDMIDATSMGQVSGNEHVPTSNASFHFKSPTIFSSASNVGFVSNDNADGHASNVVTTSKESDVSVMNPKVDATFLKVESDGTNMKANHNTENTAQLIEMARPKTSTSLNAVTRTNIAYMAANDDNDDKPRPKELFIEMDNTQQTLSSNRALAISCDTQPTCRTVFEKLMEHEILSDGTCAVEVRNESDFVLRESKVQNYIKSDFSRPNDNMCDNAVAMSSPSATFSHCTKNDESTISMVDTSYCCDTSNCSAMTSASSTSEHVEWLHRMIDEAQIKLRMTRKKLEERMKVLNNRSTTTTGLECTRNNTTTCSVEDHHRHDPALSQSFDAMTVPAEVSLTLSAALSSTHVASVCTKNDPPDDVPIDYKFISSLLSDRRSHNISDGKVNVTLPDLPPEVGVSLLLMSK